jgi:hypothetical protein
VLVAELAGEVVAAVPIDGGRALADPFQRTTDIVSLLRLRARQIREASGTRGSRVTLWNRVHARRVAV